MNRSGFSWKRFLGVSVAKSRISHSIGNQPKGHSEHYRARYWGDAYKQGQRILTGPHAFTRMKADNSGIYSKPNYLKNQVI